MSPSMNRATVQARLRAEEALKHLAQTNSGWGGGWKFRLLGQGEQAHLFMAEPEPAALGDQPPQRVVVKLYKQSSAQDRLGFLSERHSLEVLAETLASQEQEEWSLHAPKLFFADADALTLVMSALPGRSIDGWLSTTRPSLPSRLSMSHAILAALQTLWSRQLMYGDLNLKNILCDAASRSIGFVDPGLPHELFRCDQVSKEWYPASRDLAYLLYSVAVSVRSTLLTPAARSRQLAFVKLLLSQYVQRVDSTDGQTRLLTEIRQCAQVHLGHIQCQHSPYGRWRRLVKLITQGSLDGSLAQVALASGVRA